MKMDFFSLYKEFRNRLRKYQPRSIVRKSMDYLWQPVNSKLEELKKCPWQVLLLVKWALQDPDASDRSGKEISLGEFHDLRQRLYDFPKRMSLSTPGGLHLFMRRLLRQQLEFQHRPSQAFVREAALLGELSMEHPLRLLFREKTGLDPLQFVDLAFGVYAAVMENKRTFTTNWFSTLRPGYGNQCIDAFIRGISRDYEELMTFCRSIPGDNERRASEFYESTPLKRFPFLRTGANLEYWHPMVFYRGMEGFVHSVLSEAGQDYIDRFSKLFEGHVLSEIQRTGCVFFGEEQLRDVIPSEQQVPDALISFPDVNVFVESKCGLFDESVMVAGHPKILAHKTKALQTAIAQGWSASVGLRTAGKASNDVLNASKDYLLIITNKKLNASRGTTLYQMYPAGKLDYPCREAEIYLPLQRTYVLSIDDFERLMTVLGKPGFDMPKFLNRCVESDNDPSTAKFFFEQHLNDSHIPTEYSPLVSQALDHATERLANALSS